MYQRKVGVDMLNAVKSVLADVSSVSPLSEQKAIVLTACLIQSDTMTVRSTSTGNFLDFFHSKVKVSICESAYVLSIRKKFGSYRNRPETNKILQVI